MFNLRRILIFTITCVLLIPALTLTLQAQTNGAKIEIEGTVSQIDAKAGTFVIENLTVNSTSTTRYEDRQDRNVSREKFFSDFHANDRVEVEGYLKGNVITAHKIEIEHHRH